MKKSNTTLNTKSPLKKRESKSYYIFIVADGDRNRVAIPSAYQLAQYRLNKFAWGLAERTRYRKQLKPGDFALIYISGHREYAQHLVGVAELNSECTAVKWSERGVWDAPSQIDLYSPYKVDLKNINIFKDPLCIRPLIGKLSFIKQAHLKLWRIYFQGGIAKIPKEDFELLKKEASRKK
jgi:hypothetical protein